MAFAWLKNLFKGTSLLKGGSNVIKVVNSAGTVVRTSRISGVLNTVRQLPIIRIVAGSAVGIMIIDAWNSAKGTLENTLGLSGDGASLVLGVGVVICLAVVVSAIIMILRRD